MLIGRKRYNVDGVRNAGGEGAQATLQIERCARIVKEGNTGHTNQHADQVLELPSVFAEEKLANHNDDRVYEVKYRGRTGLDVSVGTEKKKRCQATAHDGDKAHLGQSLGADTDLTAAAVGQSSQRRQGQEITQKSQRHGIDPIGINIAGHQRHQSENDRAEYDT